MTEGATCARGDLRVRTAGNARVIAHVGLRTTPEVSGVPARPLVACRPRGNSSLRARLLSASDSTERLSARRWSEYQL